MAPAAKPAGDAPLLHVFVTSCSLRLCAGLAPALGVGASVWQVHRLPPDIGQRVPPDARPAPVALADAEDGHLVAAMREQWPSLRVVLRTRGPSEQALDWMLAWRAHGVVGEEAPAAEVARALRAVAAGEYWTPRAWTRDVFERLHACEQRLSENDAAGAAAPTEAGRGLQAMGTLQEVPQRLQVVPQANDAPPVFPTAALDLTDRERATLMLLHRGLSNKEIARELHISFGTVKKHVSQAFRKMGVQRRRQLIG